MKKGSENKKEFVIPFSGLKEGIHSYNFEISKEFFENISYSQIDEGNIQLEFVLEKRNTMMILEFKIDGEIQAPCDRCLDPVTAHIESENKLYVKFGEESSNDSEEIVVLHESDYEIDIAPYTYEFIVLAIPSRIVHEEKDCNQEYLEKLEEYSYHTEESEDDEEETDPRWDALKKLK